MFEPVSQIPRPRDTPTLSPSAQRGPARPVTVAVSLSESLTAHVLVRGLAALGLTIRDVHAGGAEDVLDVDVLLIDVDRLTDAGRAAWARCQDTGTPVLLLADAASPRGGGSVGTVLHSQTVQELAVAIRRAALGQSIPTQRVDSRKKGPVLTPREREVLTLMVTGASNEEIAASLEISPNTIRTHVQNLMGKLDVDNRLAAAALGRRLGLVAARPVIAS